MMAREHDDAKSYLISRARIRLVAAMFFYLTFYVLIQYCSATIDVSTGHIYLVLGNLHMKRVLVTTSVRVPRNPITITQKRTR